MFKCLDFGVEMSGFVGLEVLGFIIVAKSLSFDLLIIGKKFCLLTESTGLTGVIRLKLGLGLEQ